MTNQIKKIFFFLFFFTLLHGQLPEMLVPVQEQIPLLLKVVSFQKSINADTNIYTIGILYQKSYVKSQKVKKELLEMNDNQELLLLNGTRVHFIELEVSSKEKLKKVLNNKKLDAVYITPLRSFTVKNITASTRKYGLLSMTGVPEYVEQGISVGIGIEGEKPQLIVNLAATEKEGAEISSRVLNMARIIQ